MGKKIVSGLDKKYNKIAKEIQRHVDFWKPFLGLEHWEIETAWTVQFCSDGDTIRARSSVHFEYRTARIEFYMPSYSIDSALQREDTVVHELVHCLVDPLNVDENARKMLEMVVVDITKSLLRIRYASNSKKAAKL